MKDTNAERTGRRWPAMLVGLALTVVFAWLTFRKVDWRVAVGALRSADWKMFGLIPVVLGLSVFVRALRWRLLLPVEAKRYVGVLYRVAGVGVAANSVLPGKLGEVVSAHALGRLSHISRVQAIGIVLIGRVADLFLVSTLVASGALLLPRVVPPAVRGPALLVLAATGGALLLAGVLPSGMRQAGARAVVECLTNRVGVRVGSLAGKLAEGLSSITDLSHLLCLLGYTLLLWMFLALALWIATYGFGFRLAIGSAPLLVSIAAIGAILPSAPGNVGTYHFFGVLALGLFGVGQDAAVACIVAYHAIDVLSCVFIGALCAALTRGPLWEVFRSATNAMPRPAKASTEARAQTEPESLARGAVEESMTVAARGDNVGRNR